MSAGCERLVQPELRHACGLAALDQLTPEWDRLCERMGGKAQPFWRPDWVRAHVTAFERADRLHLWTVYRGDQLEAVLPLLRERVWFRGLPSRRLRTPSGAFSPRFDLPLVPGAAGEAVVSALAAGLRQAGGWEVLELRDVPAGGSAERLVAELGRRGHPCGGWHSLDSPFLAIEPSLGAAVSDRGQLPPAMAQTSKKFRAQLALGRRQLEADGEPLQLIRLSWQTPTELAQHLERFYKLEHQGWKGSNGSSILARPGARVFMDQVAAGAAARGTLVLHRLELGTRTVALGFGLLEGDCFYILKWAYDEAYARSGPGHLLIEAMLADLSASTPPLRRFDFLGENEPYKLKWTKDTVSHQFLFAFAASLQGSALHQLKFVWTPRLRRWLGREQAGGRP